MSKLVAEPGVETKYQSLNPNSGFSLSLLSLLSSISLSLLSLLSYLLSPIEGGPDYRGELSPDLEKDKRYL